VQEQHHFSKHLKSLEANSNHIGIRVPTSLYGCCSCWNRTS